MTRLKLALSLVVLALGLVLLVETAMLGGELGYVIGGLFVLAGGGRLALRQLS